MDATLIISSYHKILLFFSLIQLRCSNSVFQGHSFHQNILFLCFSSSALKFVTFFCRPQLQLRFFIVCSFLAMSTELQHLLRAAPSWQTTFERTFRIISWLLTISWRGSPCEGGWKFDFQQRWIRFTAVHWQCGSANCCFDDVCAIMSVHVFAAEQMGHKREEQDVGGSNKDDKSDKDKSRGESLIGNGTESATAFN